MKAQIRLALYAASAFAALATHPTRASDAERPLPAPRFAVSPEEGWDLRPTVPVASDATPARPIEAAERKPGVRVVYPALIEPR